MDSRVMKRHFFFKAPWDQTLTVVTVVTGLLLTMIALMFVILGIQQQDAATFLWAILPVGILAIAALFMVQGYYLEGDRLRIQRLGWQRTISLDTLIRVTHDPLAMQRSIRLFGNGGLFAFSGIFWNRKLGRYTAYATVPRLAVVLTFIDQTIVITPERPDDFTALVIAFKFPPQTAGD